MKHWIVSLAVLGALPLVANAQQADREMRDRSSAPTTRPYPGFRNGDSPRDGFGGPGWRFSERLGVAGQPDPSEDEWNDVKEFVSTHLPNATALLAKLPADRTGHRALKRHLFEKVRELQQLKDRNKDLYNAKLEQAELGDQIMGLRDELRKPGDRTRDEILADLRKDEESRMKLEFTERDLRIKRLTEQLEQEKKKLGSDKELAAKKLEERMTAYAQGSDANQGPPPKKDSDTTVNADTRPQSKSGDGSKNKDKK